MNTCKHIVPIVAWTACALSGATAAPILNPHGVPIDRVVTVQPIAVCTETQPYNCGLPSGMDTAFATEVLAKAGIGLAVMPLRIIHNTALYGGVNLDSFNQPGLGQSSNRRTLNTWLTYDIQAPSETDPDTTVRA